jgi:hypothetical protein
MKLKTKSKSDKILSSVHQNKPVPEFIDPVFAKTSPKNGLNEVYKFGHSHVEFDEKSLCSFLLNPHK